jgi:hypothetical protein
VVVAAFDNDAEFEQFIAARSAELRAKQNAEEADEREHMGGTIYEPGDRERAHNLRLFSRGVWPPGWDPSAPLRGISIVRVEERPETP